MTQAQKIAKDKFKKAIEYRTKTGVSLKEAFAHIYGKKDAVKKKDAPKKKAATKKVASKKSILNGIKQKFIFDIYKRNQYGDSIPSSKKSVSIVRSNSFTAKDFLYKKYPSSKYFIELESSEKIGAIKNKAAIKKSATKKKAAPKKVIQIDNFSNKFLIDRLNYTIKMKEKLESIYSENKLIPIKLRTEFNKTIIKKFPNLIKIEKEYITKLKKMIK
jgi:hypothetical protein